MCVMLISVALLFLTTDVSATGTFSRLPDGITLHKGKVSWDDARNQCEKEGGMLASPINGRALNAMKSVIGNHNINYFIGTKATDTPGQYVSIEGIALENMPLAVTLDMIQDLDQLAGECLAMSRDSIYSVPCKDRLPYMCYNTQVFNMSRTNCGPIYEGYKYYSSTGYCYKLHTDLLTWDQAHAECATQAAYLAIIENAKQAQVLKGIDDFSYYEYIHIGVRRYFGKYGFISIRGQPVEELYDDWYGSVARTDLSYQCGALHKTGKWQNYYCDNEYHFICQREPKF